MKKILALLSMFFWGVPLLAATCHVITATGGGTKSGLDWNNPCLGFSGNCAGSAMVRGDLYYVAGGAGGAYSNAANAPVLVVSTAASGTTPITIRAATVADHCTATGFNAATMAVDGGAGQVDLVTAGNAVLQVSTSYVVIDGNFQPAGDFDPAWGNPGHACAGTQCGFLLDQRVSSAASISTKVSYGLYIDSGMTNVTLRSVEYWGAGTTAGNAGITTDTIHAVGGSPYTANFSFVHTYMHDSSQDYSIFQNVSNVTWEWSYFLRNFSHVTAPAIHGSCISFHGGVNNLTVAYNAFNDTQGTACLSLVAGGPTTNDNVNFFGNLIWLTSGNPSGVTGGYDNGVVSCTNGQICTNWRVFNNTIVNQTLSTNNTLNGGTPGAGSSIKVYNNLFFNSLSANNQCANWTSSCVYDYQYYSGTTQNLAGPNDQTTSVNPFVGWPSGNFNLVANTTAGFNTSALLAANSTDYNGNPRTTFSRGALEFVSGGSPPGTPTNLTGLASGSSAVLTWTASLGTPTITYTVGRATVSGGPYTAVSSGITGTTFTDTGLAANTYYYVVSAQNSSGSSANSAQTSVTIVAPTPALGFSTPALAFGTVTQFSTSSPQTVTVTSTGSSNLVFASSNAVTVSGANAADFALGGTCTNNTTLAPAQTCTITATFTPSTTTAESAAIVVVTNDPNSPESVGLSGTGSGNIVINPSTLGFGNIRVSRTSTAQTVTYTNQSGSTVTFTSVAITGGDASQFAITSNGCTGTLTNGSQCQVSADFAPTSATCGGGEPTGNCQSAIVFTDSSTGSPRSVTLTGHARKNGILKVGSVVRWTPHKNRERIILVSRH